MIATNPKYVGSYNSDGLLNIVYQVHEVIGDVYVLESIWKCQVLCSLKTHKNQFGIGTEQLDRYLSSFCAVREGRKFSRRGLCRAGSVVA